MLEIGKKSPNFKLPRDGGGFLSLSDFAGKTLVIFFYPKDDTSGCTKEAIGFTEHLGDFDEVGAAVIGVSKDTIVKHEKFITKHGLKVPLLSDVEGEMCDAFGVWKEKSMYGKTYMGIERSTFIIDGNGIIREMWTKVRVKGHVETVLNAVQNL